VAQQRLVKPSPTPVEAVDAAVADAFRQEWGRLIATLVRRTGDWDLAEECAQGAFERALEKWPLDGLPDRPGAWLMTVAGNLAIDRLRRRTRESAKLKELAILEIDDPSNADADVEGDDSGTAPGRVPDDRLSLIFTCCHPALALESRVALTLRTLAGLTTAEIARAFLIPEATMAKRLVRAKHKIAKAGIPYRVPAGDVLVKRTSGVLAVLYLLFNEGYSASAGSELVRANLCNNAIELSRLLVELMPDDPEAKGLLALMLMHRARQEARVDERGDVVTLEDQDRSRWNRDEIKEAERFFIAALGHGSVGSYQLQAAIAREHIRADEASSTDWRTILNIYDHLISLTGSPIIELNRAVAVAMCDGLSSALALVEQIDASGRLDGYYLLPAFRADLYRRLGCRDKAASAYREALELVGTEPERRFLVSRLSEVSSEPRSHR
jgi:RNA polymerase sigma-70 factor (ECF subfamily)